MKKDEKMTVQPATPFNQASNTPLERISQLCAVLALIEQMTNRNPTGAASPDERILTAAYRAAPGIARRQFDVLAEETSRIATAGAQALLKRNPATDAPAALLSHELQSRLQRLGSLVGA
jgi:hypothetical protein